ncbi:MAG: YraN family protein [Vicinamibacterales bacterium]
MSRARVLLGEFGEDLACDELRRRGYEILARRYRCRSGEIDIVARDAGTLAFIEVKTRVGHAFGSGLEAVTWIKQRRIMLVALDYLVRHGLTGQACRFDIVAVTFEGEAERVEICRGAFDGPRGGPVRPR